MKVKPKVACADMSRKKDKALGAKPFKLCKKVIKKWASEIPPPPSS